MTIRWLKSTLIIASLTSLAWLSACQIESLPGMPTVTPSITLPPDPTSTATPTATVTPTLPAISREATPIPQGRPITAQNTGRIRLFAQFGRGFAFSLQAAPNGKALAVASQQGISLYDAASLTLTRTIPLPERPTAMAFSPDGGQLAAGSTSGRLWLIDMATGSVTAEGRPADAAIQYIVYAHNADMAAISTHAGTAFVIETRNAGSVQRLRLEADAAQTLVFSGDDTLVHTWDGARSIKSYSVHTGQFINDIYVTNSPLGHAPQGAVFSTDGSVALVNQRQQLRLYDLNKRTTMALINTNSDQWPYLAYNTATQTVIGFDGQQIIQRDVKEDGAMQSHPMPEEVSGLLGLTWLPGDNRLVFLADRLAALDLKDGILTLPAVTEFSPGIRLQAVPDAQGLGLYFINGSRQRLSYAEGSYVTLPPLHDSDLDHLSLNAERTIAAFVAGGEHIIVRDLESGETLAEWQTSEPVRALAIDPSGERLAVAGQSGALSLRSVTSEQPEVTVTLEQAAQQLRFNPDGGTLLAQTPAELLVLDLDALEALHGLAGRLSGLTADGTLAAIATFGLTPGTVVYDLESGESILSLPEFGMSVAFNPAADVLALSGQGISLWQISNGRLLARLELPGGTGQLSFSEDGKLLLASFWDGRVAAWGVP